MQELCTISDIVIRDDMCLTAASVSSVVKLTACSRNTSLLLKWLPMLETLTG